MKLGEALSLRARQAQQIKDLRARIESNAQAEKGEGAAENAAALLAALLDLSATHRDLVYQIHLTNATTDVDGVPLLKLLQEREHLIRQKNICQQAADASTPKRERFYGGGEKTYVPTLNVPELRGEVERLTEEVRVIDAQVQEINWRTDLLGT